MVQWTEMVKFLNDIGVLPLVLLLFAFPIGLMASLVLLRRLLFKSFSFMDAWKAWLADHRARTEVEIKLEERIRDLVEQVKNLVIVNSDNRSYIESILNQTRSEHELIIRHLRDILLLWKRDLIQEDATKKDAA